MSKFMNRPPPSIMSTAPPTSSTFVEKIMVGLDHAPPAFDLRGQLIGAGGANLHYIRNETGAIATLRGRGSKFIDPTLGVESPEPMHLYIEHTRFDGLQSAKQLAKNLIETLQQELIHFQQINPPMPSVQYSQSNVMQSSQVMNAQSTAVPQMSVPPPMLAVPPPVIQSSNIEPMNNAPTSVTQQQTMLPQNVQSMGTTVQAQQQQQPPSQNQQATILQQQTMMSQSMPIHLHQGNMVIQQQVQANSVSIPQQGIHMPVKQGPLVHLQAPPPTSVHLSQPPPNIQIQQPQTTQIVLNQSQPNYQYQYIQQPPLQAADGQQNQVTIQHIYQPQGLVQQTTQSATHLNQFTASQTIRPGQPQQYIVNTAYMVPPPNIIQQTQPPPQPQHNIVFQTAPPQPGSMHLQQLQLHPPPNLVEANVNSNEDTVKEEQNSPESGESDGKVEEKSDIDNLDNEIPSPNTQLSHPPILQQPPPPLSLSQHMQMRPPNQITSSAPTIITQVPPPIMTAPPPMSCVQHIVGNTLITTSQSAQTQTHQIYNQIPVSIQAPQQQIHVSAPNGQHFLVNAQQWQQSQQQFQQVGQNGNIQSIQLTSTQPMNQTIIGSTNHNGDMRGNLQSQQILATTFNPHVPAPTVSGMQLQFQPIQTNQQIMQPMENHHHHHHHHQIVDQQQIQSTKQQTQIMSSTLQQPPPPANVTYMDSQQKINGLTQYSAQGNSPQPVPYPHQMNMPDQPRIGQKRKRDSNDMDDLGPPRMGMGSNIGGKFLINQRDVLHSSNLSTNSNMIIATTASSSITTSSSNQDEVTGNNNANSPITSNSNQTSQQLHQLNSSTPTFMQDNRQLYRIPFDATSQPPPPPPSSMGGPPRGPRFSNIRNEFMRPPHMNDGNFQMHRMVNYGPPPPPPQMYQRMPPQARFRGGQW